MKHEDKKHFDISKPRRQGPDPTSRPMIVGHHPMMPDPMIREEREKAARPISVTSDGDEPESLSVTKPQEGAVEPPKPDNLPDLSDISAPHETSPALTPSAVAMPQPEPATTTESAPGAVFSPTNAVEGTPTQPDSKVPDVLTTQPATQPSQSITKEPVPPVPPEPPAGQELHIPAGHGHATVHYKPRLWVWLPVVAIVLAWAYAAVDALTDTKLPVEFFKNLTP